MPKIEIYTTQMCPFCVRTKQLLARKGVNFTEISIDGKPPLREEMESRSQRSSVPQIFIDAEHIGGFDDMAELDVMGELDEKLGL